MEAEGPYKHYNNAFTLRSLSWLVWCVILSSFTFNFLQLQLDST